MNKSAVFTQWMARNAAVAPFSVGGGGGRLFSGFRGPTAPNALEDAISNLRRRYLKKAPNAVAQAEKNLREGAGAAFNQVPRGEVVIGRGGFASSEAKSQVLAPKGLPPQQGLRVFDPTTPGGRAVVFHEVGHLTDPYLNPNFTGMLRQERHATRDAFQRMGNDPAARERLLPSYGTYLQNKFPLPDAVQAHMKFNPIQARANEVSARHAAASRARTSELGGLQDSFSSMLTLARDPQLTALRARQSVAGRIAGRNINTPAQELSRLRTLPTELRPQMQDWFDAQRRRIDIAFGEGAGDEALAPILKHIGWGA